MTVPARQTEFISTEIMFNSVEMELARRHAVGEVPPSFVNRPVEHLRTMVKAWWQLYHEASAAAGGQNRTLWERNQAYPALALNTPALIDAFKEIRQRIDLDALKSFRPLHHAECSAISLLDLIRTYYTLLNNQTTK